MAVVSTRSLRSLLNQRFRATLPLLRRRLSTLPLVEQGPITLPLVEQGRQARVETEAAEMENP